MPRAGGESDKLGNRYEGLWTVHNLLDVLAGDAVALEPESYEESKGIEFIKTTRDNSQEFHSVKRQRPGAGWTLSALTSVDERGRSVLNDLFEKLDADSSRRVVFVSTTVHTQAYEAWDRSQRCQTPDEFKRQLATNKCLHEDFSKHILPLFSGDLAKAFARFRALRLVPFGEDELRRQIEISVRRLLYRVDNRGLEPGEVVLQLADFISGSLGRRLLEADIRGELQRHGYYLRDWARDTHVQAQVAALNERYLRHVKRDLILGCEIPRLEATTLAQALSGSGIKTGKLLVGAAERGKSCVLAQVLRQLEAQQIPFLALRLDNLPHVGSTKALGNELQLPDSPAIVLAGLSQGRRAVLAVDQLDAMSVVSGRNPALWQVFEELVDELRQHPNLRLLLACRAFDLENDPRLASLVKQEGTVQRVDLGLLPVEVVQETVKKGGGMPERLSGRELELLRTPFLLSLFLQGEPANPTPFGGRQQLFARFWEKKRRKAAERQVDFERVVGMLVDELSQSESISAPVDRLDPVAKDADVLVSDNVLVLENGRYRFFHESFFDYAFARRFVRERRDLVRFLTSDCVEQHLFRRSQVRQVLAYQREDNWGAYLVTLKGLLNHAGIRIHLKKLALDWLAQLDDPRSEEWEIVEPLLHDSKLRWGALELLWGRLPWFDLLENLGVLSRLLAAEDPALVDICARAVGQQEFLNKRSPQVAKLLRPYRGASDVWSQRLRGILQLGHFHQSREMFDLVLQLLDDGLFDANNTLHWHALTEMAEQRPEFAVVFLVNALRHVITQSAARGDTNPFADRGCGLQIDPHFIHAASQRAPELYAQRIVPIIKELVLANARPANCGGHYDDIWHYLSSGPDHDAQHAVLSGAKEALQALARINPVQCEAVLEGWQELEHKTLRFLLLCAWLGNPGHFAERAAQHFVTDRLAFEVRYDVAFGDDVGRTDIALSLLKAISPLVSDESHARLESAIHGYVAPYELGNRQSRGNRELALWSQLLLDRLSRESRLRIETLRRKFPERKLTSYEKRLLAGRRKGGFVPPPIPAPAFPKMTDEQWIKAFRRYNSTENQRRQGRLIGDAWQLHAPVRNAAKADRRRFAALALKLPDDILPIYFDAILWGLVDESREVVKGGEEGQRDTELPNDVPLATETLLQVVQRVHRLPGKPCGKAICRVADASAKRSVPVELVEIVADYAIRDPDPESEIWNEDAASGQKYYGGDPLSAGINSARGSAADSFSRFLFAHPEMADRLYPYIKTLAHDKSIAVRAVNVQGLLALLNTHREAAVALFLETCGAAEPLWAVQPVEDFLYYATFTHYAALRPLLRKMLSSSESDSRHAAARQVTLAAFNHPEAIPELEAVLNGDEECRRAAAEIYSLNVRYEAVREVCVSHLKTLFNDASKRVRDFASSWFRERSGTWTEWQRSLLLDFVGSPAFWDGGSECMMNLHNTPGALPPEFLKVARRAVDAFEEKIKTDPPHAFGFSYQLPALVVRFYEQSRDEPSRRECLDLLDRMLSLGMSEAANEMSKADR